MRDIKYIVVHCTATSKRTKISSIQRYWKNVLGWRNPGYHYIIKADGEIVQLLDESKVSNGVRGYNSASINISYIGGIDTNGLPKDTRTEEQKDAIMTKVRELLEKYPGAEVRGHREFPNVAKACPSFDVQEIRDLL